MIDYRKIILPVNNGTKAVLMFKKYSDTSGWVCEMDPDAMELLEIILECGNEH